MANAYQPSFRAQLAAYFRQGLKDLQSFVLNPWETFHGKTDEPGTIANPTIMDVHNQLYGSHPANELMAKQAHGVHGPANDNVPQAPNPDQMVIQQEGVVAGPATTIHGRDPEPAPGAAAPLNENQQKLAATCEQAPQAQMGREPSM